MTTRARQDGFTLLEVIVALAILSVAVVAAIQGFAQGLRLLRLAGEHQQATLLADQKAREVIAPAEGHEEGRDEQSNGAFTWERTTTVVPMPDLAEQPSAANWRVYRVDVHVRWGRDHDVEVTTLRTAQLNPPAPPGSPSAASRAPARPAGSVTR